MDKIPTKSLPQISDEEYMRLSDALDRCHAVYYHFWQFGRPRFTEEVSTAAIQWHNDYEQAEFLFNPTFWEGLDFYNRVFVIAHEMLHVILNHGPRFKDLKDSLKSSLNTAIDIVVNHLLVGKFGFDRTKIANAEKLCWVDTVFPDKPKLATDMHAEFYLKLMPESIVIKLPMGGKGKGDKGEGSGTPMPLDDHDFVSPEDADKIIGKLDEELTPEEKDEIKDVIDKHYENEGAGGDGIGGGGRGTFGTGSWTFVKKVVVKPKPKWETVVKKWAVKNMLPDIRAVERWGRKHRRLTAIDFGRTFLPCELDVDAMKAEERKLEVFFFLDVSGSCAGLADRFWRAANSLPPDRFDVRLFWFNTYCGEVDKKNPKIRLGGGTTFQAIERHVQVLGKEVRIAYPDAVWVMTDGYGGYITVEHPTRW